MEVLSYQPHSRRYSLFPHDELYPVSKFWTPSSSNLTSRQSSIPDQNKRAESVSQLRETDDVDGDESSGELPSLRKLLSPTTQPPRNPSHSHSLNPSVQTAGGPASTPPGATSALRKSLLKNVPAWSPFNSSKYASRELNEPTARPPVVPSRCASRGSSEREPVDGSVGGGHHISRGSSQEKGAQMPGSAHGDPPPRGDQEHKVHQIVGESGSEYEVTALTKIWLPKASVDLKLVREYRAEQRAATRVPTRRSSRLQNKN